MYFPHHRLSSQPFFRLVSPHFFVNVDTSYSVKLRDLNYDSRRSVSVMTHLGSPSQMPFPEHIPAYGRRNPLILDRSDILLRRSRSPLLRYTLLGNSKLKNWRVHSLDSNHTSNMLRPGRSLFSDFALRSSRRLAHLPHSYPDVPVYAVCIRCRYFALYPYCTRRERSVFPE